MSSTTTPAPGARAARESFASAAAAGRLCLPACLSCGAIQYPSRDACSSCLSLDVEPREVSGAGRVIATTVLQRTNDPKFAPLLPLRIASVRLDAGPLVIAFLRDEAPTGRVHVSAALDAFGQAVLVASVAPPGETT